MHTIHNIWNAAGTDTNVFSISMRAWHAGAMDEFASSSWQFGPLHFSSRRSIREKRQYRKFGYRLLVNDIVCDDYAHCPSVKFSTTFHVSVGLQIRSLTHLIGALRYNVQRTTYNLCHFFFPVCPRPSSAALRHDPSSVSPSDAMFSFLVPVLREICDPPAPHHFLFSRKRNNRTTNVTTTTEEQRNN
jgi:hypothetical protein